MSNSTRAGVTALLAAPLVVLMGIALLPTVSDDAGDQVSALTAHRGAAIAGLTLQTIAIAMLIGGAIWLARELAPHAPRLATAGGVLAVAGSLIPLYEDGVAATFPALTRVLDPAHATVAIHRIQTSAAISALGPVSLLGDLGLALLGVAAVRAGAPRRAAVLVTLGAFGEGAGFGSATRPLILAGFALLFLGLVDVVRARLRQAVPAPAAAIA